MHILCSKNCKKNIRPDFDNIANIINDLAKDAINDHNWYIARFICDM